MTFIGHSLQMEKNPSSSKGKRRLFIDFYKVFMTHGFFLFLITFQYIIQCFKHITDCSIERNPFGCNLFGVVYLCYPSYLNCSDSNTIALHITSKLAICSSRSLVCGTSNKKKAVVDCGFGSITRTRLGIQ